MSTFGEKLKQIRKTHDWSQEELASVLGTSKQVISRYENNQRTPKITTAQQYADILQIPLKYLIDESIDLNHVKSYKTFSEFYSSLNLNENPKWEIKDEFDDDLMDMVLDYHKLNNTGKVEARKRVKELTFLDQYFDPDNGVVTVPASKKVEVKNTPDKVQPYQYVAARNQKNPVTRQLSDEIDENARKILKEKYGK